MMHDNLTEEQAKLMQPLVLAMIGDSVQTLFVRRYIALNLGVKVNKMNRYVSSVVSAGAQFRTFKKIEDELSEEEQSIALRARNAHIHSKAKNFSIQEYKYATALEALIGYLYLTGNEEKLNFVLESSISELVVD